MTFRAALLVAGLVVGTSVTLPSVGASASPMLAARIPSIHQITRDPGALTPAPSEAVSPRRGFLRPARAYASFFFGPHSGRYRSWKVTIAGGKGGPFLEVDAASQPSKNPQGYQVYEWTAHLPASDVRFGKNLRSLRIHTGTDLGAFGSLNLHLASEHVHTDVLHCGKTGKKTGTFSHGGGSLEGNFEFDPQLSFMPSHVGGTSFSAGLEQESPTRHRCTHGSHSHHSGHFSCWGPPSFDASDGSGNTLEIPLIQPEIMLRHQGSMVGLVRPSSYLVALLPDRVFTRDAASATIDASKASPLFRGSLTFVPTGERSSGMFQHCHVHYIHYVRSAGAITGTFDTGAVRIGGAGLKGERIRIGNVSRSG